VILEGIKEGRQVFANTTKYIKATLASNFGNFYAVAVASLFIDFLPMLPIQILMLNLLSDFPMISISTDNVDAEEIKTPKKYNVRDITLVASILGMVSSVFDFIFFAVFYRIGAAVLQTNWFIGSILTELFFLFSIRTKKVFFRTRRPSGTLVWLTGLAAVVTVALPFTGIGQSVFKFHAPSPAHLAIIFSIVAVYFVCTELVKLYFYKMMNNMPAKKNF
jgi:Mg2+-importing ATPase